MHTVQTLLNLNCERSFAAPISLDTGDSLMMPRPVPYCELDFIRLDSVQLLSQSVSANASHNSSQSVRQINQIM